MQTFAIFFILRIVLVRLIKLVLLVAKLGICGICFAIIGDRPAAALVIIPSWDSSITNDPNAAVIEDTINTALQFYEARFSDPITVKITFKEMTNGLAHSTFWYWSIPYSQFLTALQNDATTASDLTALSRIATSTNPVTGVSTIRVKTANLRAIGITGKGSGLAGGADGIVALHTSAMNLSRTSVNPNKYDLMVCAEHEIDEVLGLGSGLDPEGLHSYPEDLFRYDTNGNRNFTTNGDNAYFSIDGTNRMERFNQSTGIDYGDWWVSGSHKARVQDGDIRAGAAPNLDVELIALDVIGYNLLALPLPHISGIGLSGTNVVLTCANGVASRTYYALTSTNLRFPMSLWTPVGTNSLGTNGDFTIVAGKPAIPALYPEFYVLKVLADF